MTSENLAFHNVASSGIIADQLTKTLALVREFPYGTATELSIKVNPDVLSHDAIHKRLPELRRAGKLTNSTKRRCTITGRLALTWAVL